jgi:methylated-DNA-[protein]-cysteine S-methyltransferase
MPTSATLSTPLGLFTLSADETGLCGLSLPTETPPVAASLVEITSHPLLHEAGCQVLAYLTGTLCSFDLPLSIHGTVFQRLVWEQLGAIAYGETMTYGELAELVGGRHKARAVGGAAHANPLALIIPCHRLIGTGGKLTGFGGGLPMKQALLDLESQTRGKLKNRA